MNIIEAREATLAGKTVISPDGREITYDHFENHEMLSHYMIFGEWKIKQEPVVIEMLIDIPSNIDVPKILIVSDKLKEFSGKQVRVRIEEVE